MENMVLVGYFLKISCSYFPEKLNKTIDAFLFDKCSTKLSHSFSIWKLSRTVTKPKDLFVWTVNTWTIGSILKLSTSETLPGVPMNLSHWQTSNLAGKPVPPGQEAGSSGPTFYLILRELGRRNSEWRSERATIFLRYIRVSWLRAQVMLTSAAEKVYEIHHMLCVHIIPTATDFSRYYS